MLIRVYTKTWHITKLVPILEELGLEYRIFTKFNVEYEKNYITSIYDSEPFDLGICYAYSRKILPPLLLIPSLGFINFHAAPLPEYPGGNPYSQGIENNVKRWGVTCHYMTEEYDKGKIIKKRYFNTTAKNRTDLGIQSYEELLKLFKEVMTSFANEPEGQVCSVRQEEQGQEKTSV